MLVAAGWFVLGVALVTVFEFAYCRLTRRLVVRISKAELAALYWLTIGMLALSQLLDADPDPDPAKGGFLVVLIATLHVLVADQYPAPFERKPRVQPPSDGPPRGGSRNLKTLRRG